MLSHQSSKETICYFVDTMVAIYHVLALIAFSMWLMDSSPGKDAFYDNVDLNANRYGTFIADFGFATIAVFNGAGYAAIRPISANVLVGLWSIFVSTFGVVMYAFLFALILKRVQLPVVRPRYMSPRVIKR